MATLVRDKRSCGTVLTKSVGDLLHKTGFNIWYWGFKAGYMTSYDSLGGREFDRAQFLAVWSQNAARDSLYENILENLESDIVALINCKK